MDEKERQKQKKTLNLEAQPLEDDAETSNIKQYVLSRIATKRRLKKSLHESKISPSLKRFFSGNRERLIQAGEGYGLSSKLRLFGVAILESVPNTAGEELPALIKASP